VSQQESAAELESTAVTLQFWQEQIMNNLKGFAKMVTKEDSDKFLGIPFHYLIEDPAHPDFIKSKQIITVRIKPREATKIKFSATDVDSRAYIGDVPLTGKNADGNWYHLGQVSSSVSWAKVDMVKHFSKDYDKLFPQGWEVVFEVSPLLL
jgi:hypothetical protein